MTPPNKDGSLEALVAADEGGCSGRPGGAQAPVAAKPLAELREIIVRRKHKAERDAQEAAREAYCYETTEAFYNGEAAALRELLQDVDRISAASGFGGNG